MKQIEVSDEDHARLENFSQQLGVTLPDLLCAFAGVASSRTSREALKALIEAQAQGTSWYVLRQTG